MRLLIIDAFSSRPFTGNPAAVCLLEAERPADWMQAVAAEMNLSETAFVRRVDDGFCLRWFTPTIEVELCGHATLASAHALWSEDVVAASQPIRFQTKSGLLTCTRDGDWISLDFPVTPPQPTQPPEGLVDALGVRPSFVGKSKFDKLVLVESEQVVRSLNPDFARLRQLAVRGVMVTSTSDDPRFDFVSRYFAPGAGIDEDPVTGSAHCCLGPYWGDRLGQDRDGGLAGVAPRWRGARSCHGRPGRPRRPGGHRDAGATGKRMHWGYLRILMRTFLYCTIIPGSCSCN